MILLNWFPGLKKVVLFGKTLSYGRERGGGVDPLRGALLKVPLLFYAAPWVYGVYLKTKLSNGMRVTFFLGCFIIYEKNLTGCYFVMFSVN